MANKNFVKEVRIKVEFSELSRKTFTTMIHFSKRLSCSGESNFIKRPNTKSSKIAGLSRTFLHNLHEWRHDLDVSTNVQVVGLKEPSEFGCRFGWYFYRSGCNCCCFCTNHKCEKDRTLRDTLDSDQLKRGQRVKPVKAVCLLSVMLWKRRDEVVTRFRLTQEWLKT